MLTFFVFICILMIAVGIAGSVVVFQQSEEQRPKHLLRQAEARGLGFSEDGSSYFSQWKDQTPLFAAGHHGQIRHVIYGPYQNVALCAFDYSFEHQGQWFAQTVVTFELKDRKLPRFCLWPHSEPQTPTMFERPEDAIELQIEGLADQYQLYSSSEGIIRQLLSQSAIDHLQKRTTYRIEGNGNRLAIFRFNQSVPPTQFNRTLDDACYILHALRLDDPLMSLDPTDTEADAAQDLDAASSSVR